MSLRTTIRMFLAAAIVAVGASAQAQVIGTMGFTAGGGITTDNTPSDPTTATLFGIPNVRVDVGSGAFTGYASANNNQQFGPATLFANNVAPFLTMSMPANFGAFTPTSVVLNSMGTNSVAYDVLGSWTPGAFFTGSGFGPAQDAKWTFSFTQTGAPGSVISGSATFDTTPVPEPSSMLLVGLGVSGMVAGKLRRKKA